MPECNGRNLWSDAGLMPHAARVGLALELLTLVWLAGPLPRANRTIVTPLPTPGRSADKLCREQAILAVVWVTSLGN